MTEEKIILAESPDAAKPHQMNGWLSRRGIFYLVEDMARYCGSTHKHCKNEDCTNITLKQNKFCESCGHKHDEEEYAKKKQIDWDRKTPIYSEKYYKYFFTPGVEGLDEIHDFIVDCLDEEGIEINAESIIEFVPKLRLYLCEPQHVPEFDIDQHCEDVLAEDHEVPSKIREAADEFNKKIEEYGEPISWFPGDIAVKI